MRNWFVRFFEFEASAQIVFLLNFHLLEIHHFAESLPSNFHEILAYLDFVVEFVSHDLSQQRQDSILNIFIYLFDVFWPHIVKNQF